MPRWVNRCTTRSARVRVGSVMVAFFSSTEATQLWASATEWPNSWRRRTSRRSRTAESTARNQTSSRQSWTAPTRDRRGAGELAQPAHPKSPRPARASRPGWSWRRWSRSRLLSSGSHSSEAASKNRAAASTEHWWKGGGGRAGRERLLSPAAKKPKASCHRWQGVDHKSMSPVTFVGFCPTVVPNHNKVPIHQQWRTATTQTREESANP